MGTASFLTSLGLVGATAVLLSSCLRLRASTDFLLSVYLVASAEVVAVSLALSPTKSFGRTPLLVVFASLLVGSVLAWTSLGRPRPPLHGTVAAIGEALRDRAVAVLAATAVAVHAYVLGIGLTVPQSLPDTMLYHLPRAALWKQHHAIAYIANVRDERVNAFPPNAEIQAAATMVLSRGDRYVTLVQFAALLAACIAIYGIARRLGLERRAAAFGALCFSTFTVVVLQTPTALNDLALAAFLVVGAYFGLGDARKEYGLMALALALAVGTKGTIVFALPALAVFLLVWQPRRRWLVLLAFGAAGLAAGSVWFLVNLAHTSHLTGGVTVDQGTEPLAERLRLSFTDLLEVSDFEATGFLASPAWGLAAFGVFAVAGAVFAVRRDRRRCCVAIVVGTIALVAAPMLVAWTQVAGRVVGRGLSAVGFDRFAPATRLPAGFGESAMHSSFGVAFVVLLVAVGALVTVDVLRGRLPLVHLVALAAVPLTVLVTVFLLAYDPQRMRYVVFSAALAASVFGVALRVRALAWAAVGLTVVSLGILVGYFVPRPGSLSLFSGNRTAERAQRWYVQAEGGSGDPIAFRFLAEEVPSDATVALDVARNTYLYPAWDAGLRRTVVFPAGDDDASDAEWLAVGPNHSVPPERLRSRGWRLALASPGGWRIYRR